MYTIDGDGLVATLDLDSSVKELLGERHGPAALWGRNRMLWRTRRPRAVYALDLKTGTAVDMAESNRLLRGNEVDDLIRVRDGSVWILSVNRRAKRYSLLRLAAEGQLAPDNQKDVVTWSGEYAWNRPRCSAEMADGSLWLGMGDTGIVRVKGKRVDVFDGRQGLCLVGFTKLIADSRNRVYALSSRGIYVFHPSYQGQSPDRPAVPRPAIVQGVTWRYPADGTRWFGRGWPIGSTIAIADSNRDAVVLLDSATGRECGTIDLDDNARLSAWATHGPSKDEMLLTKPGRVIVVGLPEGRIKQEIEYPLDIRIPPGGGTWCCWIPRANSCGNVHCPATFNRAPLPSVRWLSFRRAAAATAARPRRASI
jgi:hypothetical protein